MVCRLTAASMVIVTEGPCAFPTQRRKLITLSNKQTTAMMLRFGFIGPVDNFSPQSIAPFSPCCFSTCFHSRRQLSEGHTDDTSRANQIDPSERYLEAAIGIEPMNKGFADCLSACSPNATDYHAPIIIGLSASTHKPVSLHVYG